MAKAESSAAAAKNGIKVDVNGVGGATYDLPWYAPLPFLITLLTPNQG